MTSKTEHTDIKSGLTWITRCSYVLVHDPVSKSIISYMCDINVSVCTALHGNIIMSYTGKMMIQDITWSSCSLPTTTLNVWKMHVAKCACVCIINWDWQMRLIRMTFVHALSMQHVKVKCSSDSKCTFTELACMYMCTHIYNFLIFHNFCVNSY